ncbi:PTS galactitol transporter subunit IIC [Pseudoramibacter faecis]|uniref:PTS galactitol transporter subunit IIC n=1 Tax=Pseudoramibacter faecis TaxID=3108534 RepID=UPI002E79ACD0|nr:PTS transporter subunit IIC [Pseudoramibacter sp. HA2172]
MLKACAFVINYIVDMGASVMLPVVIAILSIVVGVKVGKAIRSGLMIGVGFVGLSLIVNLMNDNLGPAAKAMSKNFGLTLSVVDIGWPGASPMTWASNIATVAIPVAIGVNILMLILKLTRTVNVDIWNIWHMAFTGAICYTVTGSFGLGILGVVVHAVLAYKLGDLFAPIATDYFEIEGLTVPHGTSVVMMPYASFADWVFDKIPKVRDIDVSANTLQEKVGVFAEPVVIGFILGTAIGFLAGYPVNKALPLGVNMSAVMVLMPKIVKCIMDGLMPLSERAKEIMNERFQGEQYYIGLDPAILLGDPTVVTAGLIFIPLTLLIAVIVPGNQVLPFGDLATIGFFIAGAVGMHKGNLFRTLFSGSLIMFVTIWIANQTVGWMTKMAHMTGTLTGKGFVAALDQGGNPISYVYTNLVSGQNLIPTLVIGATYIGCWLFTIHQSKQRAAAIKLAEEAEYEEYE